MKDENIFGKTEITAPVWYERETKELIWEIVFFTPTLCLHSG